MSNLDGTPPGPENANYWARRSPGTWIGGLILAVLVIIGIAYAFSAGMMGRRAEGVAPVAGPPPAITAVPAPTPSDTPKP